LVSSPPESTRPEVGLHGVVGAGQAGDGVQAACTTSLPPSTRRLAFSSTISATCTCRAAGSSKVEETTSPLHRAHHVRDLLRPLVDEEDQERDLGVVLVHGLGDGLEQHGLPGARGRDDEAALALPQRHHEVEHAAGHVRARQLHPQPPLRIERGELVEGDAAAQPLRVAGVDGVDAGQGEVALAVAGGADGPGDGVPGLQAEAADELGGDVDVVRSRQVARFGRAQEAVALGEPLQHPLGDDGAVAGGLGLDDAVDEVLAPHGTRPLPRRGSRHLHQLPHLHRLQLSDVHVLPRSARSSLAQISLIPSPGGGGGQDGLAPQGGEHRPPRLYPPVPRKLVRLRDGDHRIEPELPQPLPHASGRARRAHAARPPAGLRPRCAPGAAAGSPRSSLPRSAARSRAPWRIRTRAGPRTRTRR
jgi:hypothetical protein